MIILLIGGLAVLATGIVASLTGNERFMEHREIARMARESNRRKPKRGAKWQLKEPVLLEQHRPTRQSNKLYGSYYHIMGQPSRRA